MANISELDAALSVEKTLKQKDIKFYNILQPPFKIHGIFHENGKFRRLPEDIARNISNGVYLLHTNTSGGRVRFKTNSPYIAIMAQMDGIGKMPHFALTGSAGFDLYLETNNKSQYFGTFVPPYDIEEGYESKLEFESKDIRAITINFPLYSNVNELYIGIAEDCMLSAPDEYTYQKPIVYYGHSITQGGCASRPGNSFASIISRRFHCDFINLGFSGNARGEEAIAEYISQLNMQLLVYDYDHNASSAEYLRDTHQKMFDIIREKNPELPVIMLTTTALPRVDKDYYERKKVVYNTYCDALAKGDKNVYFYDGGKIYEMCGGDYEGTVEGNHPNDLGFTYIAKVLGDKIAELI